MVKPAFVFLPLYIYPIRDAWSAVTTQIAAHPNLQFKVIVSPNLSNVVPDDNYITGLSSLNKFSNVQTFGYVHTTYAARNVSDIERELAAYAALADYPDADIGVSGIFFDETPSRMTTNTSAFLTSITKYARTAFAPEKIQVAFNPGLPVDAAFYKIADIVNIFEDPWSRFNMTTLDVVDWDLLEKSTYMVHSFTASKSRQDDLISDLADSNVGGMFITTDPGYTQYSTLWSQFCKKLDGYVRS